jgi:hypothetical protein
MPVTYNIKQITNHSSSLVDDRNISNIEVGSQGVLTVTSMPTAPLKGEIVFYVGPTTAEYTTDTYYKYVDDVWEELTYTRPLQPIGKVKYKRFDPGVPVIKFGFCMNTNSGIGFPIYISKTNSFDDAVCLYLGKTGMYEWQPEEWRDVNDEGYNTEQTAEVQIQTFWLPYSVTDPAENEYKFDFVLDYVI